MRTVETQGVNISKQERAMYEGHPISSDNDLIKRKIFL